MVLSDSDKDFINTAITTAIRGLEETLGEKLKELSLELGAVKSDNRALRRQLYEVRTEHDNLEQYGRRMSVRIEGLEVSEGQTVSDIFTQVNESLTKVGVELSESDVVRLHRSSKPVLREGRMVAQTLVKLSNWKARAKLHGLNKKACERDLNFRVHNDLTSRRYQLLSRAHERINTQMSRQYSREQLKHLDDGDKVFAFVNINSDLKIRGRRSVYNFNSEEEFEKAFNEIFVD